MPKISKRRQPHGLAVNTAAILSQEARKVSFEENSHESSSNSIKSSHSSSSSLLHIPRTSPCQNMKKMMLARAPTPCMCLSEMAAAEEDAPLSPMTSRDSQDAPASSPWGHFIDVIPDDESYQTVQVEACSPHSSPAYHPYLRPAVHARKGLSLAMPTSKGSTATKKLQRRLSTRDVEGAFEQLRF